MVRSSSRFLLATQNGVAYEQRGTGQDRRMGTILPLPEFILFRTTGKEQSCRASAFQLSGSSAPSAPIPESSFPDSEIRALTSALVSESTRPACGWRRMLEPSGVVSHLDPVGHPPDRPTGSKFDSPLLPRPAVAPAELKGDAITRIQQSRLQIEIWRSSRRTKRTFSGGSFFAQKCRRRRSWAAQLWPATAQRPPAHRAQPSGSAQLEGTTWRSGYQRSDRGPPGTF